MSGINSAWRLSSGRSYAQEEGVGHIDGGVLERG
jgi:hypothetical protein